jgi:hypothetical protein
MKKTAVEWLAEQLEQHHIKIDIKNTVVFQQAKAMEKEQIVDAVNEGIKQGYRDYIDTEWGRDNDYNPEQYYNETYKGGEL